MKNILRNLFDNLIQLIWFCIIYPIAFIECIDLLPQVIKEYGLIKGIIMYFIFVGHV